MKKYFLAPVIVSLAFLILAPTAVWGQSEDDSSSATTVIPSSGEVGLPDTSIADILEKFAKWFLGIAMILAVVSFIVSGIMYLISAGDDGETKNAKGAMKASIIGIVVILAAYVIIAAVEAALNASGTTF